MSDWKPKRFWKAVEVVETPDGFAVELDGRPVKTPAKRQLVVPTQAMGQAIASEWEAQVKEVDPLTMPVTRSANAALDKVADQFDEVVTMIADYGDSDLLCYRADSPVELAERQSIQWNPALDWAESDLGARLETRTGLIHAPQSKAALRILHKKVQEMDLFRLAAFHDLVGLSGSLILGFAAARNWKPAEEIWAISRLDETWQEELWGTDEEATASAEQKKQSFLHAKRFYDMS